MTKKILPVLLALLGVISGVTAFSKVQSSAKAQQKAQEWLDAQGDKPIVMSIKQNNAASGFVPYCYFNSSRKCEADNSDSLFIAAGQGWRMSIGFHKPITPKTKLSEAQANFSYIALDRISPEGLSLGMNWEFSLNTPQSSFSEGVEIVELQPQLIKIKVKTKLFALSGNDTTCELLMDEAAPEGCVFEIRKDMQLDLTIELPMFQSKL